MDSAYAIHLLEQLIFEAVAITAPFLIVAMVIGLAVSLFQAVTSIHEQTLSFVPKVLGMVALLLVLLPWTLRSLMAFTVTVLGQIPQMVH